MKLKLLICLLLLGFASTPSSLFAQAAEINPYGGYYWPGHNDAVGEFKNNALWGVRGGGYVTPSFELGGNFAWLNHFQPNKENAPATLAGNLGFPQGNVRGRSVGSRRHVQLREEERVWFRRSQAIFDFRRWCSKHRHQRRG